MKKFECNKCGDKDVFLQKSGNNTGLYCGECGKWLGWLNKDDIRLVERHLQAQISELRKDKIEQALIEIAMGTIRDLEEVLAEMDILLRNQDGTYRTIEEVFYDVVDYYSCK